MLKVIPPCGTNTSRIPPLGGAGRIAVFSATFVVQLVEKVQVVAPAGTAQLVVVRVPVGVAGVAEVIKTGLESRRVFVRESKSCTV